MSSETGVEDLCVWYYTLEQNLKGIGTSFDESVIKTKEGFDCLLCDGYDVKCARYLRMADNYGKE